jgi:hypothetical protein
VIVFVLLASLGCKPDPVDPKADEETDVDTDETDPVVDTDPDTDLPVDTDDTSPPAPTSTLVASGPVLCADPGDRRDKGSFLRRTTSAIAATHMHLEGGNSLLADLTGDGHLDAVLITQTQALFYPDLANLLDSEPLVLATAPWESDVRGLFSAVAFDFDDDGDLDLLITGRGVRDWLLRNDGTGFTDITETAGLDGYEDHHSTGASLSDIDGDGDLDLFIAGHGFVDESQETPLGFTPADPSRLYRRDGVRFVDISDQLPASVHDGFTFLGGWLDADDDGDDDLYLVNDFGAVREPCRLVWNDGGTFRPDDGAAGVDADVAGMGLGIGDLDGDGVEEIAVPAWNRNALYQRQSGLWFDQALAKGYWPAGNQSVGWGSEMFDVDNDGRLDLTTAYGYLDTRFGGENEDLQSDAMYVQGTDGALRDRAVAAGLDDRAPHRSMTPGDMNEDGWLDVVKVGLDGVNRFYFSRCGEEGFLSIDLRQPAPNVYAVGATVRVFSGSTQWMRRVRAGGTGYGAGQPYQLHIGTGTATNIDRLVVEWPNGQVEEWRDLAPRQNLKITRVP